MLLQKEKSQNQIKIKGYKNRQVNISGELYATPILLSAYKLSLFNAVEGFSELTAECLLPFIPKGTEIVLIGCGETHQFMPQNEVKRINDLGIAVEVMGTRQACHTFQVLTYENREIIALLFP